MDARDRQDRWTKQLAALVVIVALAVYFERRDEFSADWHFLGVNHFAAPKELVPPSVADQLRADPSRSRPVSREKVFGDLDDRLAPENKFRSSVYEYGFGSSAEELLLDIHKRAEEDRRDPPHSPSAGKSSQPK